MQSYSALRIPDTGCEWAATAVFRGTPDIFHCGRFRCAPYTAGSGKIRTRRQNGEKDLSFQSQNINCMSYFQYFPPAAAVNGYLDKIVTPCSFRDPENGQIKFSGDVIAFQLAER